MSTKVQINGREVEVTGQNVEAALGSLPFKKWQAGLAPEFQVQALEIQSVDFFGPRVGFVKMKATVSPPNELEVKLPGIAFMRGDAVGILTMLECEGKQWALVTLQPRFPTGMWNYPEIPAGMLDDHGSFAGAAAKEMEEETGIVMPAAELVDLTALAYGDRFRGIFPSAGGCDEAVRLFLFRKRVTPDRLKDLAGKMTGLRHEGELITLKLVPLEDLWTTTSDAKTLSALALYDRLLAAGKLPAF